MSTAKTTLQPAYELSDLRSRVQDQLCKPTLEPEKVPRLLDYEKKCLQTTIRLDDPIRFWAIGIGSSLEAAESRKIFQPIV